MPAPKRIPRHIIAGVTCGFLAILMFILSLAYYIIAAATDWPPPPVGFAPAWSALVSVLALVPINLWSSHCAARPIAHKIAETSAEVRQALDKFGKTALEAAERAGEWKGMVTEMRNNPPSPETSSDVISILNRRNGNAG